MSAHSILKTLVLAGVVVSLSGCGNDDPTVVPTEDPGVAAEFVNRALSEADAARLPFEVFMDQWQEAGGPPATNWSYDVSRQAWRDTALGYQSISYGGSGLSYEIRTQYRYQWTLQLMSGGAPTSAWNQADSLVATWFRALDRYVVDDVRELDDAYGYEHWGTVTASMAGGAVGVATGSGHVEGQERFPNAPGGPAIYAYDLDYTLEMDPGPFGWLCAGAVLSLSATVVQGAAEVDVYAGTLAVTPGADLYTGRIDSRDGDGAWVLNSHRSCGDN